MIETLKFNLHFMETVKRKLVTIKSMVSVQNSTLSLNYMVIIGMHTPIFFPDENAQHPTRKHDGKYNTF